MAVAPENAAAPQAAASGGAWRDFLSVLSQAAQAESALLQLFAQGREIARWRGGRPLSNGPPEPQVMRLGRVYSQVDLPGTGSRDQPLRALKCAIGADGVGLLTLERRAPDFRAIDGMHLSNLLPYLGQALEGWLALRLRQDRARLDDRLAWGLGAGWMVLGPAGNVLDLSPWLGEMLGGAGDLRLRGGWLDFADPALAQAFQQAVAGPLPSPPVALSRRPPLEMILTDGRHGGERALIAGLRHARAARATPVAEIARAFDLSRSEARLAMLLCDGFSLAEAAQELGWTLETTRSCSKQVYARMAVGGQPGVLRRMLNSPVWLGAALRPPG